MTFPPEFWSWVKWKDHGSQGWLPPDVRRYFIRRGWSKAPLSWKARYALHVGTHFPKPPPAWTLGQRCVYFSNVTDYACHRFAALGPKHTALVTADPHPLYQVTDAQLAVLRSGGGKVASWSDSSATPYSRAEIMCAQRDLDFPSGQAENCAQWWDSIEGGVASAPLVIGEPAVLREGGCLPGAIAAATSGATKFIGEMLHPQPGYSAQGIPISSVCVYVDMDEGHGGYQPLESFSVINPDFFPTLSVYTGAKMTIADWDLYERWTR